MTFLKGWRTRLFATATFLLGAVEVLNPQTVANVLPPDSRGYVLIAFALITYLLRQITTTPPGKSK